MITHAGRYFLDNDLTQCTTGISITMSDVKLELRGHTILGFQTAASVISVSAPGGGAVLSNIEIAGPGTVTGANIGIDFEDVHNSRVHNLVVVGNVNGGIVVNTTIPTNASPASTDDQVHDNEFHDNVVTGNLKDGITVTGSTNDDFRDNVVTGNIANGITVNGGNGNSFIHNNLSGNVEGLVLLNTNGNMVRRNTADSNTSNGIDVGLLSTGNTIENNTALGSSFGVDLIDQNPSCQTSPPNTANSPNSWTHNSFNTSTPISSASSCIQ
jgi:parallel beta-helix repeat protein